MFIGLASADEDVTIEAMVEAAIGKAESLTNNLFRAQQVEITTDAQELYLPGHIKSDTLTVIDAKTLVPVTFEEIRNYVKHSYNQPVIVTYSTDEWLPDEVKMYVLQAVGVMYERGVEKITEVDVSLLNRYKIIAIC